MAEASGQARTDVDRVIAAIDVEIQRIRDESDRPGWNRWALLLAFGGLFWLITGELGTIHGQRPSWIHAETILAFFLSVDLLQAVLFKLSREDGPRERAPGRYRPVRESAFEEALVLFLLYVGLATTAVFLSDGVLRVWTVVFPCAILAAVSAFMFLASWTSFALPVSPPKSAQSFDPKVLKILILGSILSAFAVAAAVHMNVVRTMWLQGTITVSDIRFAGLVVAVLYLLPKLAANRAQPRMVGPLLEIRRDLAFGRTTTEAALMQTDVIVIGARLSDVLQKDLAEYLTAIESVRTESKYEEERFAGLLKTLGSPGPLTPDQRSLVQAAFEALDQQLPRIEENIDRANRVSKRVLLKAKLFAGPNSPDIQEVRAAMQSATESAAQQYKAVRKAVSEVSARVGKEQKLVESTAT